MTLNNKLYCFEEDNVEENTKVCFIYLQFIVSCLTSAVRCHPHQRCHNLFFECKFGSIIFKQIW